MELPPRSTLDPTNRDIPLFRSFERKDLVKYQAGAVGGFCERSGDEQSRIIIGAVRAYLPKGTTILFLFTEYFFLPSLFSSFLPITKMNPSYGTDYFSLRSTFEWANFILFPTSPRVGKEKR